MNNPLKEEKLVSLFGKPKDSVFLDDKKTWDAFRAGKESAFIHIYETYFDVLYAYGWRIAADEPLIKDAIQEMFIDLRKHRERLGKTDSIKFYLFKCLKRKLYKEASKWDLKREDFPPSNYFDFTISHEQRLIDRQIDADRLEKLNVAIKKLSPRKKEIIYYCFYEGMDYKQIQEIMGLENPKVARNLMYKALGFLREVLGDEGH
ncbi:RNA polymerase sigma factor [Negadavirga shengliensis]|uniref:RNA polymerase sigma factor n=1 Tax=Negadavirga shengliensis TaxID=1389218 RepID=A0ABV9SZ65_9BACT